MKRLAAQHIGRIGIAAVVVLAPVLAYSEACLCAFDTECQTAVCACCHHGADAVSSADCCGGDTSVPPLNKSTCSLTHPQQKPGHKHPCPCAIRSASGQLPGMPARDAMSAGLASPSSSPHQGATVFHVFSAGESLQPIPAASPPYPSSAKLNAYFCIWRC